VAKKKAKEEPSDPKRFPFFAAECSQAASAIFQSCAMATRAELIFIFIEPPENEEIGAT